MPDTGRLPVTALDWSRPQTSYGIDQLNTNTNSMINVILEPLNHWRLPINFSHYFKF